MYVRKFRVWNKPSFQIHHQMCLFKIRPNISRSNRAEIITDTGKVTFPEPDPQLVETVGEVWCYPLMDMFTSITWSSTLKCTSVSLLFLCLKTNESKINRSNSDLHLFCLIHPVQKILRNECLSAINFNKYFIGNFLFEVCIDSFLQKKDTDFKHFKDSILCLLFKQIMIFIEKSRTLVVNADKQKKCDNSDPWISSIQIHCKPQISG